MTSKIYMLIGCPGSGKTWITNQLGDQYHLCHHDARLKRSNEDYVRDIDREARATDKPVIVEAPFSVSEILDPLKQLGHDVTPMFIQEPDFVIAQRYLKRERKPIPAGHLSRQRTYKQRADQMNAFAGTAEEIASTLRSGHRMLKLFEDT